MGDPLAWLAHFGVEVRAMNQLGTQFDLILKDERRIPLGTADDVLTPKRVRAAIAGKIKVVLPQRKQHVWDAVAAALFALAKSVDIGAEPDDELRGWILAYAPEFVDVNSLGEVVERLGPTKGSVAEARDVHGYKQILRDADGRLYLPLRPFHNHVKVCQWVRISEPEMCLRLHRAGWENKRLSARGDDGEIAKASCWISPPKWFDD
jgi:hypothetical protein